MVSIHESTCSQKRSVLFCKLKLHISLHEMYEDLNVLIKESGVYSIFKQQITRTCETGTIFLFL